MSNDTWHQPALVLDEPRRAWKRNPVVNGQKYCTKCLTTKPVTQYSPRGKGRNDYQSWCKTCMSATSTERSRRLVRERRGLPLDTPRMQGSKQHRPLGYTYLDQGGYLVEKTAGHHRGDRFGWVYQHILVAEKKYGIQVTRDFTVHHINGVRTDNRPENLDLRWGNHGKGADVIPALLRLPEMRAVARAVLAQYDDGPG